MSHPGSGGAMHEEELLVSQKGYVNEIVVVQQLLREYKYNEVVSTFQSILFPPNTHSVAANQPEQYNQHQSFSLYAAQGGASSSASFGYIYMLKLLGFA